MLSRRSSNSALIGDKTSLLATQSSTVVSGVTGRLKNTLSIPGVSKSRASSGRSISLHFNFFLAVRKYCNCFQLVEESFPTVCRIANRLQKQHGSSRLRFRRVHEFTESKKVIY